MNRFFSHIECVVYLFPCLKSVLVFTDLFTHFAPVMRKQRRVESKNLPPGNKRSVDPSSSEPCSLLWPILVAAFQFSAGKEVALGGSAQFALYWAEVKHQ